MFAQRETVIVTTAANGSATVYTSKSVTGRVLSVAYTKDDFANGVDFAVTTDRSGQNVWTESDVNASKQVCPRQATHSVAGVAATYDDTRPVLEPVVAVNERIKIVVASGGDTKSGTFDVIIG